MSKLIVNTGTLFSGGAERVLSILSKPFADAFDEVQYVMWLDAKFPDIFYKIDPRVKIVKMSKASGYTKTWQQMWWFRKYVKKEKPDIVLSFMVMICFTVTISLCFTGITQVVAERNDPRFVRRKWLRSIINWSYLLPDIKGILMQTEWNKSFFKNKYLIRKTSVIHNPIDIDKGFIGAATRAPKKDLIVSVGRLSEQKQQWILIEAFAQFHKTHHSHKLIIFGEGAERSRLEELSVKLGVAENVVMPGRSKDVIRELLSAQMFVLTSKYEGMSNALIEALCVGLPCISTKVSGATDLIVDGLNGNLTEIGDVQEIASTMCKIADNPILAKKQALEAMKIYNILNPQIISKQWVNYLISKC